MLKHQEWLIKNFKKAEEESMKIVIQLNIFLRIDEDLLKKETYMKEFMQCIIFLEPKYAVPFASYICHLHKETIQDNKHLTTPYELETYIKANYKAETLFKIMNPGGKYSDKNGFYDIKNYNFQNELELLKKKYEPYLKKLYKKEENYKSDFILVKKYFEDFISKIGILRLTLRNFIWIIDTADEKIRIDFYSKRVELLKSFDENKTKFSAHIHVNKSVLYRSVKNYIFSNIDISKRWNVKISRGCVQKHLYVTSLISLYEARIIPILPNLIKIRFIIGYLKRLPELFDYFKVLLKLRKSVSEVRSYISGVAQK